MSKIIIASTQWPFYGGAATNAYALIKFLRKRGHTVAGIFFENKNVDVDPDKIGGVWRLDLRKTRPPVLRRVLSRYLGGRPDIAMGKNYAAPVMLKDLLPDVKVVYLVTGSPQMVELSKKRVSSVRYLVGNMPISKFPSEEKCIKRSDLVVPNSPQAKEMLIRNYGPLAKITKPIDTSLAFNRVISGGKEFCDRKYDLAFICSNFSRTVKNADLAKKIFQSSQLSSFKKIVVGSNSQIFNSINNTEIVELSSQDYVLKVLKDTRVIVCTSYYDASPNTIKEGIMCGTNILVSKNCGWNNLYPDEFVCRDVYNPNEWVRKINFLIDNKVDHTIALNDGNLISNLNEIIKGRL